MADVFLHIGLPKTGTTSIQAALDQRADALAAAGIFLPGGRHRAQQLAAYDLLGQRIRGDEGDVVPGAFGQMMAEINACQGRSVVVSEEEFGLATRRNVRRIINALRDHRVFVIVGVRDFGRTVVSAWQQSVVMGGTCEWQPFVDAVRDPDRAGVATGTAFWVRHDLLRVLDTWGACVAPERIRIVTLPPPGSPSGLLMERFAEAAELPAVIWGGGVRSRNQSLGAAELEVIRRLNERLLGVLNKKQYRHVIERGIRARLQVKDTRSLSLPAEDLSWARERSETVIAEIKSRGHPVYGVLDDLISTGAPTPGRRLDDTSEAELLAAAEAVLLSLATEHGMLFRRYRREFFEKQGRPPTAAEIIASSTRASVFHLKKSALVGADRVPPLAWAARTYLRRKPRRTASRP
jgi:hypothetical protein